MRWVGICVAMLLVGARPARGDDQTAAERDQAQLAQELALRPRIDASQLRDVIRLGCDGRDLITYTPLSRMTGQYRVVLSGPTTAEAAMPQPTAMVARGLLSFSAMDMQVVADPQERNFILLIAMFDAHLEETITVSKAGGRIILALDRDDGTHNESIQLTQDPLVEPGQLAPVAAGEAGSRVRLSRQMTGTTEANPRVELAAATFAELRRAHGREVDELMRPMIAKLGQEAEVFGVDPREGYEVLAGDVGDDPAITRAIEAILPRLDAEDFKERRAARRQLEELGQRGAIALLRRGRAGLSPEAAGAVDDFLAPYRPLSDAAAARLGQSTGYLLDILLCDDLALRKLAAARLERRGLGVPDAVVDGTATAARRCAAVDELRARWTAAATRR